MIFIKSCCFYSNIDKNKRVEENDHELENYNSDTPIHIACEYYHLSIDKYLVSKGINIEVKDKWYERTSLYFVCEYSHLPIVEYLISKCVNCKIQKMEMEIM